MAMGVLWGWGELGSPHEPKARPSLAHLLTSQSLGFGFYTQHNTILFIYARKLISLAQINKAKNLTT